MKLYLLKRKGDIGGDENAGFVVRANDRDRARELACAASKDSDMACSAAEIPDIWLDPNETTCEGLPDWGREGVVLRDFRAREARH